MGSRWHLELSVFDHIKYALFPPDTMPEFFINVFLDLLPDIVIELSKSDAFYCGVVFWSALFLTVLPITPIFMILARLGVLDNADNEFKEFSFLEYIKMVVLSPVMVLILSLVSWIPIALLGRVFGYVVYPIVWICSVVLGIFYSILQFFL